jgi:hypothetical protein
VSSMSSVRVGRIAPDSTSPSSGSTERTFMISWSQSRGCRSGSGFVFLSWLQCLLGHSGATNISKNSIADPRYNGMSTSHTSTPSLDLVFTPIRCETSATAVQCSTGELLQARVSAARPQRGTPSTDTPRSGVDAQCTLSAISWKHGESIYNDSSGIPILLACSAWARAWASADTTRPHLTFLVSPLFAPRQTRQSFPSD